jgi:hypothetical protein
VSAALVARFELKVSDLEEVKNLVAEADMAVQLLAGDAGPEIVQAAKEGLESALDALRDTSE